MPKSRVLINILLLALIAGLGALVYFRPGLQSPPDTRLTRIDPDSINNIEIENGRGNIRLVRNDTGWRLPELGLAADDFQVGILLDLLSAHSERRYPRDDIDPEAVGLAPPQATLRYNDYRILLGKTQPLQKLRYVQYEDQVHLIQDKVMNLLKSDPSDLASRRLVPRDRTLAKIALPDFTLSRTEKGGWSITPEQAISEDRLQQLADAWSNTQALWLRPASDAGTQGRITLEFEHGDPIVYGIIRNDSNFILVRRDLALEYHLSGFHADSLLKLPAPKEEVDVETSPEEIEPAAGNP